jgi:hypothetical protein
MTSEQSSSCGAYTQRPFAGHEDVNRLHELISEAWCARGPALTFHVGDLHWRLRPQEGRELHRDLALWFDAAGDLAGFAWPGPACERRHPVSSRGRSLGSRAGAPALARGPDPSGGAGHADGRWLRERQRSDRHPRLVRLYASRHIPAPHAAPPTSGPRRERGGGISSPTHAPVRCCAASSLHQGRSTGRRGASRRTTPCEPAHTTSTSSTSSPLRPTAPWPRSRSDGSIAARAGLLEPVGCHPNHRRRGLSRLLVTRVVHELFAPGADSNVYTPGSNAPALSLYRSIGFRAIGDDHDWVRELGTGP